MRFENKLNKNYDAWIQWNLTNKCNFDCEYCFGHSNNQHEKILPIKINSLIETLDKTNRIFRIGFTGGEPFLIPNFIETARRLTEKHFISINSHFTSAKVKSFLNEIDKEHVLFIHASLHFDELIKKNLFEQYVQNFNAARDAGFNIYSEAVAYPDIIKRVDEILRILNEAKIDFNFAPFIGKLNGKNYPESYTNEERVKFGFKKDFIQHCFQKGKYCNAGMNVFAAYFSGKISPCFQIHENLGNLYSEINFRKEGTFCPANHCACPMNFYDSYLFEKAKDIDFYGTKDTPKASNL